MYIGSNISKNGLVLCLDAGNKKSTRGSRSLTKWDSWTTGSGSTTGYSYNGLESENIREIGINPFGNNDIVWTTKPSGDSGGDGGWNSTNFNIDNTKLYRFSVWVKRVSDSTNGNFYLGLNTNGTGDVYDLSDNSSETNPYFEYRSISIFNKNTWYLVVGHCFPNDYVGNRHSESGIYTIANGKIDNTNGNITDCKFPNNATNIMQRVYHYYSLDSSSSLQFYQPRVDLCDGTQPSISDILHDVGNKWFDLSNNGNYAYLMNSPTFSNGSIQFRSSRSQHAYVNIDEGVLKSTNLYGSWSIETVFKSISAPTSSESFIVGKIGCHGGIYIYPDNTLYHAIKTESCWTGAVEYPLITMTYGKYYHTVMVYNNGIVSHYLNGILIGTSTLDLATYGMADYFDTLLIGGYPSTYYCTNSDISIVKCYNKSLSDKEVLQNYKAYKTRFNL